MSRVDVVVPCYNYGRFLTQCVESILIQEGVNVQVLIINDASCDDTATIAHSLSMRDSRVRVYNHAVNRGNISTYNEGISYIDGEFFLLLSADDWLVPGALSRAVKIMKQHPDVVLTHGRALVANSEDPVPTLSCEDGSVSCEVLPGCAFIERSCLNAASPLICTPTAVVRASTQRAVGGYSARLTHAGDLEMWLRFACHGSMAKLDAYQAVYRKHDKNMHSLYEGITNLRQHALAFESAFEKERDKIVDYRRLTRTYSRSLAYRGARMAVSALKHGDVRMWREYGEFVVNICRRSSVPSTRALRWKREWRDGCLNGACEDGIDNICGGHEKK